MRQGHPWRIFLGFFFSQWILYNLIFAFLLFLFSTEMNLSLVFGWRLFAYYFVLSGLTALLLAWRFTRPILRIMRKVLRISSKRATEELDLPEEELLESEFNDYSEIEYALERIRRKMKKRKERMEREREETQAFMSSVQEGLVSVSLEEKLLYFNSQFATQFLDPQQMQERSLFFTDVFRDPEIYGAFESVLKQGITKKVTVRLSTKLETQPRFFSISLTPLRKAKVNEIYGVIGVFHDVTDIKKAEQIRIEFVANASHELRTPLTSVKGYMDTLKEDFKTGRIQEAGRFIDIVSRNVDRLMELVNDLLSLSTLEQNSHLKIETVHPLSISDHVVKELMVMAAEKKQVIKVSGHIPDFQADAGKVEQVLRNLVSNAIKYIPEGKMIQIVWEKSPLGETVLRVIDDGPGIPEEHHARLFERFYRIDKGRSRDSGGTGLGLAIVKHIMQSHHGHIQVKSQIGQGAEFICTFP